MEQLELLWDYQTLDLKIDEIKNEKKSSTVRKDLYRRIRYIKSQQKSLEKLNNDIDKRNHIYSRIYHEFENINNSLKEEERLVNDEEISSLKQLDQIEKRILEAQEKLDEKKSELAVLLKDMEALNKKLHNISIRLKKGKEEYDRSKAEYDVEVKKLDSEVSKIKLEKKVLREKVEESLLATYETIRGNHSRVLAKVIQQRCGGCNMGLASLAIQNIRDKSSIIKCENCGRILYYSPDTSDKE